LSDTGVVTVISSAFNPILKLFDAVKKYQKKKRTEEYFIGIFEKEIKQYLEIVKRIRDLSEKRVIPILESVENELMPTHMRQILESMSDSPLLCAELIKSFISFAKACGEATKNLKGFMENLRETNLVLYDFVNTMKNAYVENGKVKINGGYYRFFQCYKNEIFKKEMFREIEIADLDETVKKLKRYVRKIKHYTEKPLIKRTVRGRYKKNFKVFLKEVENVTIEPTTIIDLRVCLPEKLLPVAMLIDEYIP